jgi:hypothetical protein
VLIQKLNTDAGVGEAKGKRCTAMGPINSESCILSELK